MRALVVVAVLSGTAVAAPVQLTWVVHPANGETLESKVELEVTNGGKTSTIKLEPKVGALLSLNEVECKTAAYPLEKNEVAKITFYEGGADGYLVRRRGSAYELVDWFLTDGGCDDKHGNITACPRQEKRVQTVAIPAKATLVESIVQVDAAGKRTPFVCDAPTP
ncbi:MAG TPA: hypothetical protein VGM39_25675 [Kofleriaceae bacterium]